MITMKSGTQAHPTESALAEYLGGSLRGKEKDALEAHIASCDECLQKLASAHESVNTWKKERKSVMKRINPYLVLAIISFALSFAMPRYFIQLLVATLILGIKWIVDAKSVKMLVMIYEAWKKGGEKEATRILEKLDHDSKNRF